MSGRWSIGRSVSAAVLALVASSTLLGGTVHAQEEPAGEAGAPAPSLGGYEGRAHSSGMHVFYNPAGVLPITAPVNLGAPDALATITSGPSTFGRAAVLDPGDLLVNPDALLTQLDPSYPAGTLPPYPFRISATSTFGEPAVSSRPAPGLEADVEATPEGSTARASTAGFDAPAIANLGSMSSSATTEFDGSTITVRARTEVADFDLLGLLTIDSIVTEVVATSSGDGTEVSGGTTIGGASLLGEEVNIDENGIHPKPDGDGKQPPSLLEPLLGPVREVLLPEVTDLLEQAGIRISVPGPVKAEGETTGELGVTGLRIDIEVSNETFPVISQLSDLLPPLENPIPGAPGIEDLLALAQARHLVALDVGRAQVALTASPSFEPPPFEAPTDDFAAAPTNLPSTSASDSLLPAPSTAPATPAEPSTPNVATPGPSISTETPAGSLGAGIGALALLALLLQPFLGDRLARATGAVLATGPADTCPLENP